jgi:hypothetical protein
MGSSAKENVLLRDCGSKPIGGMTLLLTKTPMSEINELWLFNPFTNYFVGVGSGRYYDYQSNLYWDPTTGAWIRGIGIPFKDPWFFDLRTKLWENYNSGVHYDPVTEMYWDPTNTEKKGWEIGSGPPSFILSQFVTALSVLEDQIEI